MKRAAKKLATSSVMALVAIPFYQSPRSLFPSGEASYLYLQKNRISIQKEASYLVEKDRRNFWVSANDVVRDVDLDDQTAITIANAQIRESDSWQSAFRATVPAGTRLKVIGLKDTWAEVIFESIGSIRGWVDLNNLILKADFAAFVLEKGKTQWRTVRFRDGTVLVADDSSRIELAQVQIMKTKQDLAISINSNDGLKLLRRQHLKIIKADQDAWNISRLNGHGNIYWKNPTQNASTTEQSQIGISTEELLKREVVSVSFHPKNPLVGLASAQGIFLTLDGKHWQSLGHFGQKNFPVLIDHSGNFYVGAERSRDQGKNFNSYFRWEHLTHMIEQVQKLPGKQLRIKDLNSPRAGILEIQLETDLGKINLAARSDAELISKWDFN